MQSSTIKPSCPCCSYQLLRHIRQQQLTWFCCNCRQEMPNFNTYSPHFAAKSSSSKATPNKSITAVVAS